MWSTGGKMAAVAENHGAVSQQFSQYCPGGSRVVFGSGNLRYSGGADSAGKPPAGWRRSPTRAATQDHSSCRSALSELACGTLQDVRNLGTRCRMKRSIANDNMLV